MEDNQLRLGEILVEAGVLGEDKLNEALDLQKKRGIRLGQILLQEGYISEPQLVQALSRRFSIPWVSLEHVDIADDLLDLVPVNLAEEFFLIPVYIQTLDRNNRTLFVAMNDPTDEAALRLVSASARMPVKPMVAGPSDISAAIFTYYYGEDESSYDPPIIHSSSPPPISPPGAAAVPPPKVAEKKTADKTESEPPELLTDDQLIEEVEEYFTSRAPAGRTISIVELSESSAPPSDFASEGNLPDIAKMVENRHEAEAQQRQVQRQVEKHMFGLGNSKNRGVSLTLLDGTTIDFGGANKKKSRKGATEKDRLLTALREAAAEIPLSYPLPSDKGQQYIAALLEVLFKKHLIFPEEFMRALQRTHND